MLVGSGEISVSQSWHVAATDGSVLASIGTRQPFLIDSVEKVLLLLVEL